MTAENLASFLKLCRLCAQEQCENIPMVNIFSSNGAKLDIVNKVEKNLPLKIKDSDGLPQQVCISCLSKLNICDNLLNTCIDADKKLQALKNYLSKSQSDEETDSVSNDDPSGFNFDYCTSPDSIKEDNIKLNEGSSNVVVLVNEDMSSSQELPPGNEMFQVSDVISGTCQVAFVIAEKKDKSSLPTLYLLTRDIKDRNMTAVTEEIAKAITSYKNCWRDTSNRISCKSTKYNCASCNVWFKDIDEIISHLQSKHPGAMLACLLCRMMVSGTKEDYEKHESNYHTPKLEDSENCEASKNICLLSNSKIFNSELTTDFNVIALGEVNPNLKGELASKQKERVFRVASHVKNIEPEMKSNVISTIRKFLSKFQKTEKYISKVEPNTVMCSICNKVCGKNLLRHLKLVHKPQIVKSGIKKLSQKKSASCCHCNKLIQVECETNHVSEHGLGKQLLCEICDKVFKLSGEDQPHMMIESSNLFKCPCAPCKRDFKKETNLLKHIKIVHEKKQQVISDKSYLCDYCGKALLSKCSLKQHVQKCSIAPLEPLGPFKCKICDKEHNTKIILRQHMTKRHYNQVNCEICGKQFSKWVMKKHILTHGKAQYPCKYCGKRLTTRYNRYYHEQQTHEGAKPAKCTICLAHFRTEQQMEKHKANKHKEGEEVVYPSYVLPFQCDICQQILSSKASLQSHIYIHLELKPYLCGKCHMSFRSKFTLKQHERTKCIMSVTYNCQYCSKVLCSKISLQNHEANHEGIRKYPCNLCDKIYCHFSSRYEHLKKFHGVTRITKTNLEQTVPTDSLNPM